MQLLDHNTRVSRAVKISYGFFFKKITRFLKKKKCLLLVIFAQLPSDVEAVTRK